MQHRAWTRVAAFAAVASSPAVAFAQDVEPFPTVPVEPFPHGPGFYFSITKLVLVWIVFLLWVRTADWISTDAQERKFRYLRWNALTVGSFLAAFLLLWVIPIFWLGWPLLFVAWLVPLIMYVSYRNPKVSPHETVLNADHIRYKVATMLAPLGIKMQAERKSAEELGPPIKLVARGGESPAHDGANLMTAKESPAFDLSRQLLVDALGRRADTIMLDYTQQAVAVRNQIDGLWTAVEGLDRESGDAVLAIYKLISGLNPRERRARQKAAFGAEFNGTKYTAKFLSQGTKTGERVVIQFDDGQQRFKKLPDLGIRDKLLEQLQGVIAEPGFFLFSSPPAGGLSALLNATLGSCDRYVRSFVLVEEADLKERPIENVPVTTYDATASEGPETVLPKLIRLYPDALVVRELVNVETLELLLDQPALKRQVFTTIRARDSVEALARVVMMGGDVEKFASTVTSSVNVRLLRKLCETCREAYAPPPQLLQKLGLPAGRIEAFYRPPQPPERPEEICKACGGVGYLGRTGLYEVLVVGEQMRAALASGAKIDVLRQVARKEGLRGLQEEGILLVAKGVTSLQELQRALKE